MLRTQAVALILGAILLSIPWLFIHWLTVPIGWVGLASILWGRSMSQGWTGFLLLYLSCTLAIAIAFHWAPGAMAYAVSSSHEMGLALALVLYLLDGARLAIPIWLGGYLSRSPYSLWFSVGLLTVVVETAFQSVFPWRLGYFQLEFPLILQSMSIFGAGISSIIAYAVAGCMMNVALHLVSCARNTARKETASQIAFRLSPLLLCTIALLHGVYINLYRFHQLDDFPKIRVAVAQVYPSSTESIGAARELARSISENVDLVCWPESIGGTYAVSLKNLSDYQSVFDNSAEPDRGLQPWPDAKSALLFGGKSFVGTIEDQQQVQVSAFLIGKDAEVLGRYDKRYLMPFGEYVPLKDWLPFMEDLFGHWDTITAGYSPTVLELGKARIGTMLCYEDMVPQAARSLVCADANVLFSLADGSSFQSPFTLVQHRLLAQARAIENRRYLVRCASTGESCAISPFGVIESRLPLQQDGLMLCDVALINDKTLYSRVGELAIYAWVFPALFFMFARAACTLPSNQN